MSSRKASFDAAKRRRLAELSSLVVGLYAEFDKLAKKDPYMDLSDLGTKRLSRALQDARELLGPDDRYLKDIEDLKFEDENPEVRDALLVLQEIRKAIERSGITELDLLIGPD